MVEIVQPRYFIETTPIRVTDKVVRGQIRGKHTEMSDLNLRVVDSYTRMPVGVVLHVPNADGAEYHAKALFDKDGKNALPAPDGGWGPRFDLAAEAAWDIYNKGLPRSERAKRWAWRWMGVGWFLIGTVWTVITTAIVNALSG